MKRIKSITTALLAVVLTAATASFAGVPSPDIPKGQGEACVKPTDDMRKNHMEYLLHKRDDTMHQGIRTDVSSGGYSFTDCMNCHAVMDENKMPVNYKDDRHFCNSCHSYAAVKIDCFDCHASTPSAGDSAAADSSLIKKIFNSMLSAPAE